MFGFDRPEDGSEERNQDRQQLWAGARWGAFQHYTWWLVHNVVAHPLIGLFPFKPLFRLHDWTSHRMHNRVIKDASTMGDKEFKELLERYSREEEDARGP